MDKDVLKRMGLTGSEIDVYLDIVRHGESLASETALRIKISRTYVYDALQNLLDKGLLAYVIKNNRKYFKALDVEKLISYIDDRKRQLDEQKKDVFELIKELKLVQKPQESKPSIEVFEGKEGLKTILNDIVKTGKDIVAWGATDKVREHLPDWFLKRYVDEKARKRMKTRQLYVKGEKTLEGKGYENKPLSKEFSNPVTFGAYGNRTIIFFWSDYPVSIRIINDKIADSFKKHFEFLWKIAG